MTKLVVCVCVCGGGGVDVLMCYDLYSSVMF